MMRLKASLVLTLLSLLVGSPVLAAERPLTLRVDGRPASHDTTIAKLRDDVAYVELVTLARIFGGLVSIRSSGTTATIGSHIARFRANQNSATIDGKLVTMATASFEEDGELYVPLAFFVKHVVPGTTLSIDRTSGVASLFVRSTLLEVGSPSP